MSVLLPKVLPTGVAKLPLRAYNDPVIFNDDRVLKTLLSKESNYLPSTRNYFQTLQTELKLHMRKDLADWMLEVCIDRDCSPEVFCLAMNYVDRFLSVCKISRSQLQLLGAVCLMVAWKVREHEPLPSVRLIEYSDYNLSSMDVVEWEVLLLSKLDWDVSSVIAFDFVEHIIHRISRFFYLGSDFNADLVRRHSEALVTMCSAQYIFSSVAPCLIACACVLTTIRPWLDSRAQSREALSPASCSSLGSPELGIVPEMDQLIEALEKSTSISKSSIRECMEQVELLMHVSLPPSPAPSHSDEKPRPRSASEGPTFRGRRLFATSSDSTHETLTPRKVLDVAKDC